MKVIIVGAGIGGLSTALALHRQGVDCEIYEKVPTLLQQGVGLMLLPHASKVMEELGVLPALDEVGVRIEHTYFRTRHGQNVWDEPRGLAAGYDVPQFALHRGYLQRVLVEAVEERLPGALHLDAAFENVEETADGIVAQFRRANGSIIKAGADALIGADGIHSAVRHHFYPEEGTPRWSGLMLWRGSAEWPTFLDGRTYLNTGGMDAKFVCYPMAAGSKPGIQLTNWATVVRRAEPGGPPPAREEWDREARLADVQELLKVFTIPEVDIEALVAATPMFWEFPMCDRDPLPRWSFGRVTLMGDAAHSMYPFGANGAAQAILDSKVLSEWLSKEPSVVKAFEGYEKERLPIVNEIVATNRSGGPERVINAVEKLSPEPFNDLEAILPFAERKAIVHGYAKLAGFSNEQVAAGSSSGSGKTNLPRN